MGSIIEDKLVPVLTDIGRQKAFQADFARAKNKYNPYCHREWQI